MSADVCTYFQQIHKQFLCSADFKVIDWADVLNQIENQVDYCTTVQDRLLKYTVLHPLVIKYPLRKSYLRFFLKSLIHQLETRGIEVSDQVYSSYCALLQDSEYEKEEFHYRHFATSDCVLTLKESAKIISQGTTGLCSWQGALALAEWSLLYKNQLHGKHILELGSGAGLTGIAVAKCCSPASYCFTDYHSAVLQLLRENIQLNSFTNDNNICISNTPVEVIKLNWEDVGKREIIHQHQPDIILAADVIYDDTLFPSLVRTLRHYLINTVDVKAILACTVRDPKTLQKFLELLASNKLIAKEQAPVEAKVFVYSLDTPIKIFSVQVQH